MRKIITKDEIKNLNKYGLLKLDYLKKNNKVLAKDKNSKLKLTCENP